MSASTAVLEVEPPIAAAPPRVERLSPFVSWSEEDRRPLAENLPAAPRSLAAVLLRDPIGTVERLADPAQHLGVLLVALGLVTSGASAFAGATAVSMQSAQPLRMAALASVNALLALAAALGPIYATGILLSTRVPLARLVAILLSAAAAGAMLLGGVAPVLHVLWKLDGEWLGPLGLMTSFTLSAVLVGARVRRLMLLSALAASRVSDSKAELSPEDAARVATLARVALIATGFTSALSLWAFDVFLR